MVTEYVVSRQPLQQKRVMEQLLGRGPSARVELDADSDEVASVGVAERAAHSTECTQSRAFNDAECLCVDYRFQSEIKVFFLSENACSFDHGD